MLGKARCWRRDSTLDRKDYTGDCTVRALTTARDVPYRQAWQELYQLQGETLTTSFNLVQWLRRYPDRFGVIEALSFPATRGRPRMTGATFFDPVSARTIPAPPRAPRRGRRRRPVVRHLELVIAVCLRRLARDGPNGRRGGSYS